MSGAGFPLSDSSAIIGAMEKGEGENAPDDGIVAEDITLLVEHIELTTQHRLPEAHEWEMAIPAADLDDAPILIGEVPDDDPELDRMELADDAGYLPKPTPT